MWPLEMPKTNSAIACPIISAKGMNEFRGHNFNLTHYPKSNGLAVANAPPSQRFCVLSHKGRGIAYERSNTARDNPDSIVASRSFAGFEDCSSDSSPIRTFLGFTRPSIRDSICDSPASRGGVLRFNRRTPHAEAVVRLEARSFEFFIAWMTRCGGP